VQVFNVANPLFVTNETSHIITSDAKPNATKLTVKLTRDRTKLKRPILFLQPALTQDLVQIL
jgi:hypothetical protein